MAIVPPSKPKITHELAVSLLSQYAITEPVAVLGDRGYYRDTMGEPGTNDRGIYDDAIVIVTPTAFAAFNANTDPSAWRPGIASLKAGVWRYKLGTHHPGTPKAYPCLVQAGPVTVHRDEGGDDTGEFYIHIHRGGYNTTSSLGCQTIYPTQWDAFFALIKGEVARYGVKSFPYVLVEPK
jgi:lysozyme